MAKIALTNGGFALVDDSDIGLISGHRWWRDSRGYVVGCLEDGPTVKMHRLIVGAEAGQIVDHANGVRSDNRRENLRICTHAENMRNRRMHKNNRLGIKGVYLEIRAGQKPMYVAQIRVDKKRIRLGRFDTAEAASLAYQAASQKYHGEFSRPS